MRPVTVRLLASSSLLLLALLFTATPAGAAVVVTDAAAFVVAIDNNDNVVVDCSGGFVRVFDDGVPTVYTTACASVTGLTVTATGAFDNTINLSGVTAATFTGLAPLSVSLSGGAGTDTLTGSEFDDTILGGPGNDTMLGGAGGDTFTWNPGDGSDTIQGGAGTGTDTLFFNGSAGNEIIGVVADGTGFDFTRDVGGIVMDVEGVETLTFEGLGGVDTVTIGDLAGVADLTTILADLGDGDDFANASAQTNPSVGILLGGRAGVDNLTGSPNTDLIDAGGDNDTIVGLGGNDVISGGDGDDLITGGPGADQMFGGDGTDTFVWNPGDGSDTIQGEAGNDTLIFNGSGGNEIFTVVAEGTGFDFTRDVGGIVMDVDTVETLSLFGLGGDDLVNTVGLALTAQSLDGGAQATADILNANAQGQCAVQTAVNGSGTIAITGAALISHTNFEQVNVLNPCGVGTPTPTVTPTATASPTATQTVTGGGGGPAPGDIPTLSGGMLALLAMSLALLGLFVLRRQ
jgi:Ca2+-binding RTX toxin-like protein